jgi:GT2 family glycosyltransferase
MTVASSMGLPPVSVIIASRDRPQMLADVIRSVLAGRVTPDELVIVDQSARPQPDVGDLDQPDGCRVRYVRPGTVGLSRANNAGARLAAHEVLVFTHDDVLVDSTWLAALLAAHMDLGSDVVVTGRVAATEPEQEGAFAPALRDDVKPASYFGRLGFDVLKPMNVLITKQTFLGVGGFDERLGPGTPFPGAEDADLGFRLLEAGHRIDYRPEAVVRHRAWRPSGDYFPLRWRYGLALGAFYAKHMHLRDPHVVGRAARDVGRRIRAFPGRVRGEGRRALGDPVFVCANVVGAAKWVIRERRSATATERGARPLPTDREVPHHG